MADGVRMKLCHPRVRILRKIQNHSCRQSWFRTYSIGRVDWREGMQLRSELGHVYRDVVYQPAFRRSRRSAEAEFSTSCFATDAEGDLHSRGFNTLLRKWESIPSLNFAPQTVLRSPDPDLFKDYLVAGDGGILCMNVGKFMDPLTRQVKVLPPLHHSKHPVLMHLKVDADGHYKIGVAGRSGATGAEDLSLETELTEEDDSRKGVGMTGGVFAKGDGPPMTKTRRELLQQQIRAIRDELGENDEDEDDVVALEKKMHDAGMPPNVWKHAQRELRRLRKMQPQQPGYGTSRTYLELLAELPWQIASTEHEIDLAVAKERLDSEHYGLSKVKKRIIEYLAVRKLKPDARGPVLCFVGPPGVGKTSLASSIAGALNRLFIRISLGGVKDEADIRGHRRTYIGSMPGRLIDGIKRVGVNNPVMLLDEIDKTGADVRGDPASALLEVLDPEQNKTFNDHYLNVPFDVSKVVFLATANRMQNMPAPLLDRMEVIELPGYTSEEKLRIAMLHLLPRVLEQHGITDEHIHIPETTVELIIQRYTREAGVRNLGRHLAALARAAAVKVAEKQQSDRHEVESPRQASHVIDHGGGDLLLEGTEEVEMEVNVLGVRGDVTAAVKPDPMVVDESVLELILGPPRFDGREAAERVATPGVAVGLVWTEVGGEVLFVESTAMLGKGDLHLTGQLGDVIKESAQIALTWVRARSAELKLPVAEAGSLMKERDIHIHFPAGAVPKDGPSAGVTLVTALVSLFAKRSVRADTAMTGEMTLRGLVLPVGGIKDKILAAHRCGIRRVILPERNRKDLQEVPVAILESMEIILAKRMEDVLHQAFEGGCPWKPASSRL